MKIITGLRRSGTSMLMLALKKGGLKIVGKKWDKHTIRKGNPKGYWEVEGVTDKYGLKAELDGEVVKVMFDCLYKSNPKVIEKILVIMRKPQSVLESVFKYNKTDEEEMFVLNCCLDAIESFDYIQFIGKPYKIVFYEDILENPKEQMERICEFMGGNPKKAVKVVKSKLNRCAGKEYKHVEWLSEIYRLAKQGKIEEIVGMKPEIEKLARKELNALAVKTTKTET